MGLANLVPGVSGGTMILALGLYDRFIGAVAELTTLRWSLRLFTFLALVCAGAVTALVGLAGVLVDLVVEHRWIMYSLFVGMTLGGVPELVRLTRPFRPQELVAVLAGVGLMAWLAFGLGDQAFPESIGTYVLMGALAASSMILPGISGSYLLLIFGYYELIVGSVSRDALSEDLAGSLRILVPVGIGAALGIGLLSNLLKFVLARFRGPSHGMLLGLLLGSVLGLFPFQEPVHPDLADKQTRKAVEALVVDGTPAAELPELDPARAEELRGRYAGKDRGELKKLSLETESFRGSAGQWAAALALLAAGFGVTQLLGYRGKE